MVKFGFGWLQLPFSCFRPRGAALILIVIVIVIVMVVVDGTSQSESGFIGSATQFCSG